MARFRLFGRTAPAAGPDPYGRPGGPSAWGPPPGWAPGGANGSAGASWPGGDVGPATRSARPLSPSGSQRAPDPDPPTDPRGFPPIPAAGASAHPPWATAPGWPPIGPGPLTAQPPAVHLPGAHPYGAPPHNGHPHGAPPHSASPYDASLYDAPPHSTHPYDARAHAGQPAPHPAEAAALAGAFAVDYLSWDQDDPERRGRVLLDYLPAPGSDPARLGWSGHGRQRAEFALPGLVRPDGDGRVLVDVRVRVTPYRSVGEHGAEPTGGEPAPDVAGVPAAAPAPTGRGWRSLASYWIRLSVPVALESGRLVVDAWEETLGEQPEPARPPEAVREDHSLADDDPLVEHAPGGAW